MIAICLLVFTIILDVGDRALLTNPSFFYRNRQPPPSGLGTASPAYVEARMYAPANATKKQVGK